MLNFGSLFGSLAPAQDDPLMGGYYDPKAAMMSAVGGGLRGMGVGLASGKPGGWAQGLAIGSGEGLDEYKNNTVKRVAAARLMEEAEAKKQERAQKEQEKQEFEAYVQTLPPEQQALARMFPDRFGAAKVREQFPNQQDMGAPEYGLNPIALADENGNFVGWGQMSKSGGLFYNGQPVDGAGVRPMDPYGLNLSKSKGTTVGKGEGDAVVDYKSISSKMPGLETVISELDGLAEEATYTLAGQAYNAGRTQLGFSPTEGAVARTKYQSMVANQVLPLLRDTFGAQFTQVEGERLLATLGDPDKSPKEKQVVLKAFIEQKRRDVEAFAVQAGQADGAGASDPLRAAREAIARGADPDAVKQRLRDNGIDPAGL